MEVDESKSAETFPPMKGVLLEVTSKYQPYVEKLFNENIETVTEGLIEIKNFVIGNNKQKSNFIVLGVIPRLVYLMQQEDSDITTKVHCAVILGSLAKGMEANVKSLLDFRVMDIMLQGLQQSHIRFYEACLRCIRTIASVTNDDQLGFAIAPFIPKLLDYINKSSCTQDCTCDIITRCCQTKQHQELFFNLHVVDSLTALLVSDNMQVKMRALEALSLLCFKNFVVSQSVIEATVEERRVPDILSVLLSRAQPLKIQLYAAKCLTYIYRSGNHKGLSESIIEKKVLPCLARMCDPSRATSERIDGAKTIAYIMENNTHLQRIALFCEQFPKKLEANLSSLHHLLGDPTVRKKRIVMTDISDTTGLTLIEAIYLAYASLLSNDEDLRNQLGDQKLVNSLELAIVSKFPLAVHTAALLCLLSLSRSVQILRTTFDDLEIWESILRIVQERPYDKEFVITENLKVIASAILCNLLLKFSPCKSILVCENVLPTLKSLCESECCIDLKRNAVWSLLNITFQADLDVKRQVMDILEQDLLLALLTCSDYDIVVRTLGILNNVLANKEHTDTIMDSYGDTIMQACAIAMESTSLPSMNSWCGLGDKDVASSIYACTVRVLGCVATGNEATTVKKYLFENEHFLRRLVQFMQEPDFELRYAALLCITTLCGITEGDKTQHHKKLKELGVKEVLVDLLKCSEGSMVDGVNKCLQLLQ